MIEIIDQIVAGTATASSGGGQAINNEDMTITSNGTYTASEGYTGIGTADVNVPQYEEKTATNTTGSSITSGDKVWIESVAGGSYEIKDFYSQDYSNFDIIGSPTISSNGTVSNFSSSNILKILTDFEPDSSWEFATKIKVSSLSSANGIMCSNQDGKGIRVDILANGKLEYLVSDGSSWIDTNHYVGTNTYTTGTVYWLKFGFDTTKYYLDYSTNGTNWTRDVEYSSATKIGKCDEWLGAMYLTNWSNALTGELYLDTTYMNVDGKRYWDPRKSNITQDMITGVALENISNGASGKVAIGELGKKYGATINNFLGDVNASGVYQKPNTPLDLVFNGIKTVGSNGSTSGMESLFENNTNVKSVSFPDLETVQQSGFYKAFYQNISLETITFPKLVNIARFAFTQAFQYCRSLTSIDFSKIEILNSRQAFATTFQYCLALQSVSFPKLKEIKENEIFYWCFAYSTALSSISFPALKSDSFGTYTGQFAGMLSGITGCTVHFPSNLQSVIGSWSDVTNGFGGTNTTVAFDLPATE